MAASRARAAAGVGSNGSVSKSWPVMLVLHGYGASGFIQDAYLGISAEARTRGVIVIAAAIVHVLYDVSARLILPPF
jgi:poly(3-hydroxybutyrate) depolymerase